MPQELNFESEKIEFWEKMGEIPNLSTVKLLTRFYPGDFWPVSVTTPADNPGELAGMQQTDQNATMTFPVFIANYITV